jgi:hypothetical protein
MNAADAAWVAGLLEGEGYFIFATKGGSCIRIGITSTDLDVLQRVHEVTGYGNVTGPRSGNRYSKKPIWEWKMAKRADVLALCDAIYPWMGSRRREQIDYIRGTFPYRKPREADDSTTTSINGVA